MITCFFENNNPAKGGLRHVTVNAIIVHENKILLGKRGTVQGKQMLESGQWGLVGGFVGRDETLVEAVKREALEETGCELDQLTLFRIKDNPNRPKEDRQNIEFVFISTLLKQTQVTDEEISHLEWIALEALPSAEDMAFDHGEDIQLYKKFVSKTHPLPIFS